MIKSKFSLDFFAIFCGFSLKSAGKRGDGIVELRSRGPAYGRIVVDTAAGLLSLFPDYIMERYHGTDEM